MRQERFLSLNEVLDSELIWSKIDKTSIGTGCWLWTAAKCSGYGRLGRTIQGKKRTVLAHRVVWTLLRGDVPEGMDLDHLCRNPCCVNPDHLEPVPHRVNMLRSPSRNFKCHNVNKCSRGHELTEDNRTKSGQMPDGSTRFRCKKCMTEINQRHYDLRLRRPFPNRKGESNATSKLHDEDVRSIRLKYASGGFTARQLADEHGVSVGPIYSIIKGLTWKHII